MLRLWTIFNAEQALESEFLGIWVLNIFQYLCTWKVPFRKESSTCVLPNLNQWFVLTTLIVKKSNTHTQSRDVSTGATGATQVAPKFWPPKAVLKVPWSTSQVPLWHFWTNTFWVFWGDKWLYLKHYERFSKIIFVLNFFHSFPWSVGLLLWLLLRLIKDKV